MAIASLFETLRGTGVTVVAPGETGYEESLKRWAANCEKPAGVVVLPKSGEEISKTVKIAVAAGLPIAVCGGGHGVNGASSSDGGLVINLKNMRKVTVNATKKEIIAEGGCIWADVDAASAAEGLSTVGGTVNHTGIAGLSLGGGYGWLTGEHGVVVDNMVSVKVVLADGSDVTASESENQDLFWAIRGAGIHFGIVYEFTYRGFEQGDVWGGIMAFPPSLSSSIIDFINNHYIANADPKSAMTLGIRGANTPTRDPVFVTPVFYNGTEEEAKKVFGPLIEIGPMVNTTGVMPYENMNALLNAGAAHGRRRAMYGDTIYAPIEEEFVLNLLADYQKLVSMVPDAVDTLILFELLHWQKTCEVKQDATAFANRGQYYNVAQIVTWDKAEDDRTCRDWAKALLLKIREKREVQRDTGANPEGVGRYTNYDGLSKQPEDIFGANYPRLRELKYKYDPEVVFGHPRPLI